MVGNWVTVKLPMSPKGFCPRSKPLHVEKCLGKWRYILSDGQMHNARRMSRFFPTEHGEEFLSEWYDWETEKQPQIPDADFVPLEAAGDGENPEDPALNGPVPEVPLVHGPVIPPNAVPPAPHVRRSTRQSKAPDRLGIRKK